MTSQPRRLAQETSLLEAVRLRRIETLQGESSAARIARLEAHVSGCILRGTSCDYYSELHQTKLD